jgi:hypothetical protein
MKITFEDKSYIQVSKSSNPNKIFITVAAKSAEDSHKLIANSVELTMEELVTLVKSLS